MPTISLGEFAPEQTDDYNLKEWDAEREYEKNKIKENKYETRNNQN